MVKKKSKWSDNIKCFSCLLIVVPVSASVSVDETEALKAEITRAVEKVQEEGKTCTMN